MKTKIILLVTLMIATGLLQAQDEDFYSYAQQRKQYYENLKSNTPDSIKISGFKSFQRWEDFWQPRVYNNNNIKGSIEEYAIKLRESFSNTQYQPNLPSSWNWHISGDQEVQTHTRGIIVSLWINPNNINEIYAGSNSGGLFRTMPPYTEDYKWECVTDQIPNLPCMGVFDIAVNPSNHNIKYIVCGSQFGTGAAYILKTIDNCLTWNVVLNETWNKFASANRVVIDPTNYSRLYALIGDKVYRSLDDGEHWNAIFENKLTQSEFWAPFKKSLLDIEIRPDNPNIVLVTGTGQLGTEGIKIYYTKRPANDPNVSEIWRMNIDGTGQERFIDEGFNDQPNLSDFKQPVNNNSWKLFYIKKGSDNKFNIYRCDVKDASNSIQLTNNQGNNWLPRVNKDQSKVLFVSDRTGSFKLYTMNIDGTNQILVNTSHSVTGGQNNTQMGKACWTPDGKIIYISGNKIYKINSDGTNEESIAQSNSNYWWCDVRCSLTGTIVAQTQGISSDQKAIYLINPEVQPLLLVSDLPGDQTLGNFSEDGNLLYYSYDKAGNNGNSTICWTTISGAVIHNGEIPNNNTDDGFNDTSPCFGGSYFEKSAEVWISVDALSSTPTWNRILSGLPNYCDRFNMVSGLNPADIYIAYSAAVSGLTYVGDFNIKKLLTSPSYAFENYYNKYFNGGYGGEFTGFGFWCNAFEISPINEQTFFCGGMNLDVVDQQQLNYSFPEANGNPDIYSYYFHVDQRIFKAIYSGGKTFLFMGNDGGITRLDYNTKTYISCNGTGLFNNQYYGIGHSDAVPDLLAGGTQDNGIMSNCGGIYSATAGSDAYEVIIDPLNSNIFYTTENTGTNSVRRTTDCGQSYSRILPDDITGGLNNCPIKMSPNDSKVLYVGKSELWRTSNALADNVTWIKKSNFQDPESPWKVSNEIQALGLTKSDPNQIILGFNGAVWADFSSRRLFKTSDGGSSWSDITSPIEPIIDARSISDIFVSPLDKNKIWLTFSGYKKDAHDKTIWKVLFSSNGGSSWTDISDGLPDLPVNCISALIRYDEYVPLIGNDMGIFLYDPINKTWENIGNDLPHVIVTDIETDLTNNKIIIGTYGRGIWESSIDCSVPYQDFNLTATNSWDTDRVINGIVTINPSATLTISSKVSFTPNSKIIIKPGNANNNGESGGKLIINGGYLTSYCTNQWQGIEVWGNKNLSQLADAYGAVKQGYVELHNATISNAKCAVELWKPGDYSTTGGIIKAYYTQFINNAQDIHALYYKNYHPRIPTYEVPYQAYFSRCNFEVNERFIPDNIFNTHLNIDHIKSFNLSGCKFSAVPSLTGNGIAPDCRGIEANSAGFTVYSPCLSANMPCSLYDTSFFTGLAYGVKAVQDNSNNYTFSISNASFKKTTIGVYTSLYKNHVIQNSSFQLNAKALPNCALEAKGVFFEGSSGFRLSNNTIAKTKIAAQGTYYGIYINNTKAVDDIYKNTSIGLNYGFYAKGDNIFNNNQNQGLTFTCNNNLNNNNDFYVPVGNENHIQNKQGDYTKASGNKFSTSSTMDFYFGGEDPILYYYVIQDNENPEKYFKVEPLLSGTANNCPYGNTGISVTTGDLEYMINQFAESNAQLQTVQSLYDGLKDGGSTSEKLDDINNAQTGDMWQLRQQLLGASPHLSAEVLRAVAGKTDVFTEAAIFDILAANPDELRNNELITYLAQKEIPLPQYMIQILQQVASGITYKTVLQMQIASLSHSRAEAANNILIHYLNDSLTDNSEIRNWFDNLGGRQADAAIIANYLNTGNSAAALALAAMMPALYNYDSAELAEHTLNMQLLNMQIVLANDNRNMAQLNESEKQQLSAIMNQSTGTAFLIAQGVLSSYYNGSINTCIGETADSLKHTVFNSEYDLINTELIITVKPNPAGDWAAVDYSFPTTFDNALLSITDITGRIIYTATLDNIRGQKLIDLRHFSAGTYMITIKAGSVKKTVKFVKING